MSIEHQLELYLRARSTLIVIATTEEDRAMVLLRSVCANLHHACLCWDLAEGFQALTDGAATPVARDAMSALDQIDKAEGDGIYLLRDFHDCWTNPTIRRKLRSLAQRLKFSKKSIVVTAPTSKIPEELKDDAVVVNLPPPGVVELEAVLTRLTRTPGVEVRLSQSGREKIIQAALGLTVAQAQRVFAKAIVADGILDDNDIDLVSEEKRLLIRESEALEFYSTIHTMADVGGLESLKQWLKLREQAFTREAREYGLPAPKGIALIGIPGTGKSLVAKMIAGLWRLPLFRLDAGSLFGSLVGESEERTRRALRVAEATAPALLWIDEIEKALAHGGLDSGTSTRVFGSILTWMQEKTAPVFVVACMTGDTVIARPDGSLPTIQSAAVGPVLSANFHQGTLTPARSDLKVSPRAKELVEIDHTGGYLRCTPNHPLFVVRLDATIEAVPAEGLRPGMQIASPFVMPEACGGEHLIDQCEVTTGVPGEVCRANNEVVARYLRHLYDNVGQIEANAVTFRTTDVVLQQQLNLLLRRFCIHAAVRRVGREGMSSIFELAIREATSLLRFAEQIGFSNPSKRDRLRRLLSLQTPRPFPSRGGLTGVPIPVTYIDELQARYRLPPEHLPGYFQMRGVGKKVHRVRYLDWVTRLEQRIGKPLRPLRRLLGYRWDRIRSIRRKQAEETVYDLRVPSLHNFVAGGLIVHNTANDIRSLPAELLRKGRFDEIFFLDLPTESERKEILGVHLRKRRRDITAFDIDRLAREAEGYVGAELEQAIIDAMYLGFSLGREFTTEDISRALKQQVPLSISQRETVQALRAWLNEGRAQSASTGRIAD